mgnify:CR=1 FL=1
MVARIFGGIKLGPAGVARAFREAGAGAVAEYQKTRKKLELQKENIVAWINYADARWRTAVPVLRRAASGGTMSGRTVQ